MTVRVAFDLDGVLADSLHRAKYVPDWELFYSKIPEDTLIPEATAILIGLYTKPNSIYFITGRPERTRKVTVEWIEDNLEITTYELYMRQDGNHEPNTTTKLRMCQEIKPDLIFEDDEEVAQALFDAGFKVMLFLRDKDFINKSTEEWASKEVTMELEEMLRKEFPHGLPDYVNLTLEELQLHSTKNHDFAFGGDPIGNFNRVSVIKKLYPGFDWDSPFGTCIDYLLKQFDSMM